MQVFSVQYRCSLLTLKIRILVFCNTRNDDICKPNARRIQVSGVQYRCSLLTLKIRIFVFMIRVTIRWKPREYVIPLTDVMLLGANARYCSVVQSCDPGRVSDGSCCTRACMRSSSFLCYGFPARLWKLPSRSDFCFLFVFSPFFAVFLSFRLCYCWRFVDAPLIFLKKNQNAPRPSELFLSCPAVHVPDRQPRTLLGVV